LVFFLTLSIMSDWSGSHIIGKLLTREPSSYNFFVDSLSHFALPNMHSFEMDFVKWSKNSAYSILFLVFVHVNFFHNLSTF
jgi:hypothetical protein